ncbi:hypothetical protein MHBO_003565, partial [Bonamia ostreae]
SDEGDRSGLNYTSLDVHVETLHNRWSVSITGRFFAPGGHFFEVGARVSDFEYEGEEFASETLFADKQGFAMNVTIYFPERSGIYAKVLPKIVPNIDTNYTRKPGILEKLIKGYINRKFHSFPDFIPKPSRPNVILTMRDAHGSEDFLLAENNTKPEEEITLEIRFMGYVKWKEGFDEEESEEEDDDVAEKIEK